jgi:LacI family xylobiose transport system transcriptional regulator
MAEQAVHLVLRLRDEPELAFSRIDIDTSLVVRESTAVPRPARRQAAAKVSSR